SDSYHFRDTPSITSSDVMEAFLHIISDEEEIGKVVEVNSSDSFSPSDIVKMLKTDNIVIVDAMVMDQDHNFALLYETDERIYLLQAIGGLLACHYDVMTISQLEQKLEDVMR